MGHQRKVIGLRQRHFSSKVSRLAFTGKDVRIHMSPTGSKKKKKKITNGSRAVILLQAF